MPDQGSRCAANFLRLPRRALEALADHEPHRKHVRNRTPPHDPVEGLPVEPHRACHGLQACRSRAENLATPRRQQPVAKTDSRCEIRRWARGRRQAGQP